MKYHSGITQGVVRVAFAEKPPEAIRSALKRNGFRWAKYQGEWQAHCWNGAAAFLAWLDRQMNPGKPDGACWVCGKPGRFRPHGASTPIRCDECQERFDYWERLDAETKQRFRKLSQGTELDAATLAWTNRPQPQAYAKGAEDYPCTDRGYEDACRDACGL